MKMTSLEKRFVNRQRKTGGNIERLQRRLRELDTDSIRDVLELGCGIGGVAAYLAETYDVKVTATDFDSEQIRLARSLYEERECLRFGVEDAARLSFADASFDLVVSQNVFHHIPDWEEALREVARVLRPGAQLIWQDLTFPRLLVRVLRPLVKNYGLYTIDDIRSSCISCGLREQSHERMLHGPSVAHHLVLRKG